MKENFIKIRGARVHNLKNIDLDIPKNKLVVITGISGTVKEVIGKYKKGELKSTQGPNVNSKFGMPPSK